jgi:hypothetical protein
MSWYRRERRHAIESCFAIALAALALLVGGPQAQGAEVTLQQLSAVSGKKR